MIVLGFDPPDVPADRVSPVELTVTNTSGHPCADVTVLLGTPPLTCDGALRVRVGDLAPGQTHRHRLRVSPGTAGSFAFRVRRVEGLDDLGFGRRVPVTAPVLVVGPAVTTPPPAPRPRTGAVFVSYRHGEDTAAAAAVAARLRAAGLAVFHDDTALRPGDRWAAALRRELARTSLVLAVIGPRWLTSSTPTGRRRLDVEDDWVRTELATALGRGVPVVPILVDGAPTPRADELPRALAGLVARQSLRWDSAAEQVVGLARGLAGRWVAPRPGEKA